MSAEELKTHSAVHVLKGAVQRVLGAKWTASVHVSERHGRLTVKFDREPTGEELSAIERLANEEIAAGAEVLEFEMERQEAEGHFGDAIYDLFPVPPEVTLLKIVRIPDWNINCCNEPHVDSTLRIGGISLGKPRFRHSRGELELEFDLAE
ncbi:MAG: alanyl-tRNA editing protein [Nitrososphaerota archaeon]|nr:alanyl-tRNA editing protein [Nitrososphaerota archaeon]MDG6952829.1 alanyl-tRNA editing protein [Nitrososphaerota archaeon]MDG6957028.1 alanyl-tRNA editing protein [Nitrososphaerota archaeon]MDG6959639.1 alanyl-tRNA editing protein [Nitrososphaerota archaeon]MDG6965661.1 alanyl-tRNA editing protein [Nitrososphaerota archaeon]